MRALHYRSTGYPGGAADVALTRVRHRLERKARARLDVEPLFDPATGAEYLGVAIGERQSKRAERRARGVLPEARARLARASVASGDRRPVVIVGPRIMGEVTFWKREEVRGAQDHEYSDRKNAD